VNGQRLFGLPCSSVRFEGRSFYVCSRSQTAILRNKLAVERFGYLNGSHCPAVVGMLNL
jgi:hypothetical protein